MSTIAITTTTTTGTASTFSHIDNEFTQLSLLQFSNAATTTYTLSWVYHGFTQLLSLQLQVLLLLLLLLLLLFLYYIFTMNSHTYDYTTIR